MTHAYSELYLEQARDTLGCMMDFAVYDLHYSADDFFDMFAGTSYADGFAHGMPDCTVGRSGEELAYEVLWKVGKQQKMIEPHFRTERSDVYRGGWVIAGYQWYRDISFYRIREALTFQDVVDYYVPYHEMDERQFYDVMDGYLKKQAAVSRLKRLRRYAGLSQKLLAERTGIPLRTIQQYEQRQKDINHAKGSTLLSLSNAMGCSVADLMEVF